MANHWTIASKQAPSPPPTAPARELVRLPSVRRSTARLEQPQRHSREVSCSSGPQHWRAAPTQHTGTARKPDGVDGGAPGPVMAIGWALAAMVAFNMLRAAVLLWVRTQVRRPRTPSAPAVAPTVAAGRDPVLGPEVGPVNSTGGGAKGGAAGARGGAGAGSAAEGGPEMLEAATASAAAPPAPAPVPLSASAMEEETSVSTSGGGAAASDSDSAGVAAAAAAIAGAGEPGGGAKRSLQVANYQLRPRGKKSNNNLGRVVICASLDLDHDPGSDAGPGPGSGFGAGSRSGSGSGISGARAAAEAGAAAGPPWGTVEWHQRFWDPLISKYADSPEDRVTGLLVLYGKSVLHILEGDNNQLFALLRELRPQDSRVHRLQEIRVPCFILDLRERLFDRWMCAAATHRPVGRSSRTAQRAAFKLPTSANAGSAAAALAMMKGGAAGAAGATASAAAGGFGGLPLAGADVVPGSAASPSAESPPPEQQLVGRIQQLELFVKFVGPKLSALATQEARGQALRNLRDFETTTPPEDVVAPLAADPLAPALPDFVEAFDADYHRYVSLLALVTHLEAQLEEAAGDDDGDGDGGDAAGRASVVARAGSLAGEIRQLARFYDEHVRRDLKEALAQREEERQSRGADEVARRLSRGMRLPVNSDGGSAAQAAAS